MFRVALARRAVPMLGAVAMLALVPFGVADASQSKPSDDSDDAPRTVLRSSLAGSLPTDPVVSSIVALQLGQGAPEALSTADCQRLSS